MKLEKFIPLKRCENGFVYEIQSRNLSVGVFVKERDGFIGIREKFGRLYLFMEFHHETGAPFGTVWPRKRLRAVPKAILLCEHLDTVDETTKRLVEFDRPIADGGRGWFFVDTGEASEHINAASYTNAKLFKFLARVEKSVTIKCKRCRERWTKSNLDKNGHCRVCQIQLDYQAHQKGTRKSTK